MSLVLLPGMDGSGTLFEPFVAALGEKYQIQVVSYPPTEMLDYPALEQVARQQLPEYGKFVILGESFSGPIAITLAAESSSRLIGLILCCTFAKNPRPAASWLWKFNRLVPLKQLSRLGLPYLLMGGFATSALRASLSRALEPLTNAVIRARVWAVIQTDVFGSLANLSIPILYLQADKDRVVLPPSAVDIASSNRMVKVSRLAGPHLLLQAASERAAQECIEFIDACEHRT